jgi:hypothetical protein
MCEYLVIFKTISDGVLIRQTMIFKAHEIDTLYSIYIYKKTQAMWTVWTPSW